MVPFAIEGLEVVFNKPKSIFIETTAWDVIWDGVPINCNQSDYQAKILCNFIRAESQIEKVTKTEMRFSLFKMVRRLCGALKAYCRLSSKTVRM